MAQGTSCLLQDQHSIYLSGKLLHRLEIPLNEKDFQSLLSKSLLAQYPAIIKERWLYRCQRCNNQKPSLLGKTPCAKCQTEHIYCRKCIEMGKMMSCEYLYHWKGPFPKWPHFKKPCTWKGTLTKAQSKAAFKIVRTVYEKKRELLIWAVTGSGKTEMMFPAIEFALQKGYRIGIATPRSDVVRELQPRLQRAFKNVYIQGLYAGSPDRLATAQIIIATTHQLLRFKRAFDLLIIDEIDAFPYHADPSLPFAAQRATKNEGTMIYLTATPRKEQRRRMIKNQLPYHFLPERFHQHPLIVPQLKKAYRLQTKLRRGKLPHQFLQWLQKRKTSRQILLFVPTISLAHTVKQSLQKKIQFSDQKITSVHAEDPERIEKVECFRKKSLHLLVTTTILERGVTFPSVDVVVFDAGHDVFDRAALIQIAGRAGRSPKDPKGEVVFFHDGKTREILKAVQTIKELNKKAGFS